MSLPGQVTFPLHGKLSSFIPTQSFPSGISGGGLVQVLVRFRSPNPQEVEHNVQSVHGLQFPSTMDETKD